MKKFVKIYQKYGIVKENIFPRFHIAKVGKLSSLWLSLPKFPFY